MKYLTHVTSAVCLFAVFAALACNTAFSADSSQNNESLYKVRPGDTLWSISAKQLNNPGNWRRLMEYNGMHSESELKSGQMLRIPATWGKPAATQVTTDFTVTGHYGDVKLTDAGKRIQTGKTSSAHITFGKLSLVLLANTEVMLTHPLELVRGSIELSVLAEAVSPFVTTRSGVIEAQQARFRLTAVNDKQIRLEVLEGEADIVAKRQRRSLSAGLAILLTASKPISEPRQMLLRPNVDNISKRSADGHITLSWPLIDAASGYRAQLVSARNQTLVMLDQRLTLPELNWKNVKPGHYRIRLRSIDNEGLEGLDAEFVFEVLKTIAAPHSTTPLHGATLPNKSPWIGWSRVAEANTYVLQVAEDAKFSKGLKEFSHIVNNSYQYTDALPAGGYYWRVKSVAAQGAMSPFGEVRMFNIKP